MTATPSKDLVVLVPGRNEVRSLAGLLARPGAIRIRPVTVEFQQHPDRDAGCRLRAHEFLRRERARFAHALVLFDRVGCGAEQKMREELEAEVEQRLADSGWGDRAAAVVIDPELEAWVWSDSPHVARCLGWRSCAPDLRAWLQGQGLWTETDQKPSDPKAAVERVLVHVGRARSSAICEELAKNVSFQRCVDPAFLRLRAILTRWFGEEPTS
jgi:hypothetical protein